MVRYIFCLFQKKSAQPLFQMSQNSLNIASTIFTDTISLQIHSDKIVVYCSLLSQCVKVAWYI